jgi:hypothetical protein
MNIYDALTNVETINYEIVEKFLYLNLWTEKRILTDLGKRFLSNDDKVVHEVWAIIQSKIQSNFPPCEWINPPLYDVKRVFGPTAKCGDMASHSMGF